MIQYTLYKLHWWLAARIRLMDELRSLTSDFWPTKTTLTPLQFSKVPIPSQESQLSCIRDIDFPLCLWFSDWNFELIWRSHNFWFSFDCLIVYTSLILEILSQCTFPRSWLITGFVTRLTRRVPLVKQELPIPPEHLSSPLDFSGVRITRSLVLSVCFVDNSLSFCTFSFGHFVVCPSIYGFWLPLWYLQTLRTMIPV